MPNVTVQVSRQIYRSVRIWCAKNNTNVSRIVRELLEALPNLSAAKIHSARSGADPLSSLVGFDQVEVSASSPVQAFTAPAAAQCTNPVVSDSGPSSLSDSYSASISAVIASKAHAEAKEGAPASHSSKPGESPRESVA